MDAISVLFTKFMIYSFLGWLCESIYCSIPAKKLINRGFLNGPVCPVYGIGALLVAGLLHPFQNNLLLLYVFGVLVTSLLEYITGFLLEKLFHMKWWDYSSRRFQLHGRICLRNSLLFGVLAVLLMKLINPFVLKLILKSPMEFIHIEAGILLVVFLTDVVFSTFTVLRLNGKLAQFQEALEEIREKSISGRDYLEQNLKEKVEKLRESDQERRAAAFAAIERLKERLRQREASRIANRRLLSAFPNLKSNRYQESLEHLKRAVEEYKIKRKKEK